VENAAGVMITAPGPTARRLAITLVTAAVRGDAGAVRALLLAADLDGFGTLVHCTLTLARSLAVQLRSGQGLMACDVWLAECSRDEHRSRESRLGAQLVLAHAMTQPPPVETITSIETFGDVFNVGASTFNEVCASAGDGFAEVLTSALMLWHQVLPELSITSGPVLVGNTAAALWAAEPAAPKLESTGGTLKHRTHTDDPPQPLLAIPVEAQVIYASGRPPRAPLAPGAPISLRGLAVLRRQEQGLE
jgi:hypothetical protein